jgi:hypothetical protein
MEHQVITGLAHLCPDTASYDEAKANARLIAAAPELLAALKECLDYIEVTMEGEDLKQFPTERSAIKQARAAIAKAEGKS